MAECIPWQGGLQQPECPLLPPPHGLTSPTHRASLNRWLSHTRRVSSSAPRRRMDVAFLQRGRGGGGKRRFLSKSWALRQKKAGQGHGNRMGKLPVTITAREKEREAASQCQRKKRHPPFKIPAMPKRGAKGFAEKRAPNRFSGEKPPCCTSPEVHLV